MQYAELKFRGDYMLRERLRREKERLIAASFSAWQILQAHVEKLPTWGKYLKQLGLSEERKLSREDLKREADHALAKVQQIIKKAGGV